MPTATQFIPPQPEELQAFLPNYSVEEFIAKGGMGAVYLGRQLSLDRPVAIKILPREFGDDESYLESFKSEAKALAKLNHTNLVGIYDFGETEGLFYIIMEYVPGRSLFYTAHGQSVDEKEAAMLIAEICHGLAHAHENGVLHRDIKPANILIDDEANPKIVDFGLAKPMDDNEHKGVIFGTLGYTAPEVVRNPNDVDQRSDIFSVGVMLYELLTGALPPEPFVTASQVNGTNPKFDKIITKAINPLATLRYESVAEMAKDLDDLLANFDAAAQPTGQMILATAAKIGAPVRAGIVPGATATPAVSAVAGARSGAAPALGGGMRPPVVKQSSGGGMIAVLLAVIFAVGGILIYKATTKKPEKPTAIAPKFDSRRATAKPEKKPQDVVHRPKRDKKVRKPWKRPAPNIGNNPSGGHNDRNEPVTTDPVEKKPDPVEEPKPTPIPDQAVETKPKAPPFDWEGWLEKGQGALARKAKPDFTDWENELRKNISSLRRDVDREIRRLDRRRRSFAEERAAELFDRLKEEGRLDENVPPAGKSRLLSEAYAGALKTQERIDEKYKAKFDKYRESYVKGIQKKIQELTKLGNVEEVEELTKELKRAADPDDSHFMKVLGDD